MSINAMNSMVIKNTGINVQVVRCSIKSSYPWRDEEFRNDVNEWAQTKIQISNSGGLRTLKQLVKNTYNVWSKSFE